MEDKRCSGEWERDERVITVMKKMKKGRETKRKRERESEREREEKKKLVIIKAMT